MAARILRIAPSAPDAQHRRVGHDGPFGMNEGPLTLRLHRSAHTVRRGDPVPAESTIEGGSASSERAIVVGSAKPGAETVLTTLRPRPATGR